MTFYAFGRKIEIDEKEYFVFEEILKSVRDSLTMESTKKKMGCLSDDKFAYFWDKAVKLKSTYRPDKSYGEEYWKI